MVAHQLVNLIQQEDRVLDSHLLEALDDTAWHGANVRTAMSSNVRLITHASQGDPATPPHTHCQISICYI